MYFLSDDHLSHRLRIDNPWWTSPDHEKLWADDLPRRWFFDRFFDRVISPEPRAPLLLKGPLKAGKTVMIHQAISALIADGVSRSAILYLPLSAPCYGAAQILRLIEIFCERFQHQTDAKFYLFLDEVIFKNTWQDDLSKIKQAWPRARVIASASVLPKPLSPAPPKTNLDEFVLPPLSFAEFLRRRGMENELFGKRQRSGDPALRFHQQSLAALNKEFMHYLNLGGFPERSFGVPSQSIDAVIEAIMHNDLPGLHGISDSRDLMTLFTILAFNTGFELSLDELAQATGVAKNTLRKYLDYLESAFLIRRVMRVNKNAIFYQRAAAFKVYLASPCFYAAIFGPVTERNEAMSRLVETAFIAQWSGLFEASDLAYAAWRGGQVDLIAINQKTGKPDLVYEMDWADHYAQSTVGPKKLRDFVRHLGDNAGPIILTKERFGPATMNGLKISLVPIALYAYWLGLGRPVHPDGRKSDTVT